jgi:hypothetical protein
MRDQETNEEHVHAMFEAMGLRVELRDGGVIIQNTMTPEENQGALARLAERSREAAQRIPTMTRELETLLLQYNAFDMLATLSVTNLMNNPETLFALRGTTSVPRGLPTSPPTEPAIWAPQIPRSSTRFP